MNDKFITTDPFYISKLLPKRVQNSNKGTYGTVLNIAGSTYYSGAAYLSSISSLKVGAGLVRLASEVGVIETVSKMSPDVTFINLGVNNIGTIPRNGDKFLKNIKEPNSIIIGCGLTTFEPVREFVSKILSNYVNSSVPIVIDADAINILSTMKNPIIPLNSVITPHPLELSRLIKVDVETIQEDRITWANFASAKFDCIVVLKGKDTVISIPNGNTFINPTGNSSLSCGGTGDILSGMIAGFAAQGVKLEEACILACYLHGLSGELASKELGEHSTLASDVLNHIPYAIKKFI